MAPTHGIQLVYTREIDRVLPLLEVFVTGVNWPFLPLLGPCISRSVDVLMLSIVSHIHIYKEYTWM